jgi:hypothetical protein
VDLYRVFDWDGVSLGAKDGGPLFVARERQGAGRHDNPATYGAWYCARVAVAAIAEAIQSFRGQSLSNDDFERPNSRVKALATFRLDDAVRLVDLDDPRELVARHLRPSQIATLTRTTTQRVAAALFREGAGGLSWWSTLDAEWTNVTLFYERVTRSMTLAAPPQRLSSDHAELRRAAERLGVDMK